MKIDQLLQRFPSVSMFFSSWMIDDGISYKLSDYYKTIVIQKKVTRKNGF